MMTKMENYNKQDNDGCFYTMDVLRNYINVVNCVHTVPDTCKYDLDMTGLTEHNEVFVAKDENKDRRWPWIKVVVNGDEVMVRDYDNPRFISSFSSQMFNYDKYEYLMDKSETEGTIPLYTASYMDAIWVCDLRTLPKDKIYTPVDKGGWGVLLPIAEQTMNPYAKKKDQPRFLIPNNYGTIYYK